MTSHADRHGEVGMRKVDSTGAVQRRLPAALRRDIGHLGSRRRQQTLRLFELPGLAAVETASEQVLGGPRVIDGMASLAVLVVARFKTGHDLVVPSPHAVVGRPAAKTALLLINDNVLDGLGAVMLTKSAGSQARNDRCDGNELPHQVTPNPYEPQPKQGSVPAAGCRASKRQTAPSRSRL